MNLPRVQRARVYRAVILPALLAVLLNAPLLAQSGATAAEARAISEGYSSATGMPLNVWLTFASMTSSLPIPWDSAPLVYDMEGIGAAYDSDLLDIGFDFVLNNDHKYYPSEQHMRGRYFDLLDGHATLDLGPINATVGRIVHRDEIPGPYSLFISSNDIPKTVADVRYDDGFFFYDTRWVELNRESQEYYYPVPDGLAGVDNPTSYTYLSLDRGMNYKVYGIDLGNLRFGLQESVVYLYKSFYPEYFLSPLPMYFTQLVNSTLGKPWTQLANENSLMGLFIDYSVENIDAFFQFLIDDWNDMGLTWLGVGTNDQPAKFAWYLGGTYDAGYGTFGLYQAGATKYTFEPTYATTTNNDPQSYHYAYYNYYPYSYTYYPVTEYDAKDYGTKTILPEDNYIGYLHGENNVALMTAFSTTLHDIFIDSTLEYTLSGSKSPSNPWHDAAWHSHQRTRLLDEWPLESKLVLGAKAHTWLGPFRLEGTLELGGVWNELQLSEVPGYPDQQKIFRPSDSSRFLWRFGLEARYVFGFAPAGKTEVQ